jgi:PKD repeat protein
MKTLTLFRLINSTSSKRTSAFLGLLLLRLLLNPWAALCGINDGLTGYYPLDGDYQDYSGNNRHGTPHSAPAFVLGKHGQCLQFDGSDDYVSVQSCLALGFGTNDYAVSLWIKSTSTTQGQMIFGNGSTHYSRLHDKPHNVYCAVDFMTYDTAHSYVTGQANVSNGGWHHLVMMRNGMRLSICYDGSILTSKSDTVRNISADSAFLIGGTSTYYNGLIDEVRTYNRALSEAEIQQLYNYVPAPADLAVENVTFSPTSVHAGDNLTVNFRVRNVGSSGAGASQARLRITSDSVLNGTDPDLVPLDFGIPMIGPQGSYNYSGTFAVPASVMPGPYFVGVQLDPNGTLGEANRANNVGVSASKLTILGTGTPSLLVTPTSASLPAGASSTTFYIQNTGGAAFSWTAQIMDPTWVRYRTAPYGTVTDRRYALILSCDANPAQSPRTATIRISAPAANPSSQDVTITQAAAPPPPPEVTYFEFLPISSPQSVNAPFAVTIRAMNGNVQPPQLQTAFSGSVDLTSDPKVLLSKASVVVQGGIWGGNLTVHSTASDLELMASTASPRRNGRSESFNVLSPVGKSYGIAVQIVTQNQSPVQNALLSLMQAGTMLQQLYTDSKGWATFQVYSPGIYDIVVRLSGVIRGSGQVTLTSQPQTTVIILREPRPPVILVPAGMGSCSGVEWDLAHPLWGRYLPEAYPLLPDTYPAPQKELKIFNPANVVGWTTLRGLLQTHFEVFDAPWDWRMPTIKNKSGGKVAWREYLLPVIANAKAQTGNQYSKVCMVTHSMGGILTRAYIQSEDYAGDIDKLAMVAPPNEGSANFYSLWFGGDTTLGGDKTRGRFYEFTSKYNYERWLPDMKWDTATQLERRKFYRTWCLILEELLPVYERCLVYPGQSASSYSELYESPLYHLNTLSFASVGCDSSAKVCTRVFYSKSENTIKQVSLASPAAVGDLYPHGTPVAPHIAVVDGDGTVLHESATMEVDGQTSPFAVAETQKGAHAELVGVYAQEIYDFLIEGMASARTTRRDPGKAPSPALSDWLSITISGCNEPWIVDPQGAGSGISPSNGMYTNGWATGDCDIGASASTYERNDAPLGLYHGNLKAFPGERVALSGQFFPMDQLSSGSLASLRWIAGSNAVTFALQLDPMASNAITLTPAVPAPKNLTSFQSNGVCYLAWEAGADTNAGTYRIYAREAGDSLFTTSGTTTNQFFNTLHPWNTGRSVTNWFFTVVAVATNGAESPYPDIVMNSEPTLARFSANLANGTPPFTVTFTNQSLGGVTNWAWDFDSDGTIDSMEENPSTIYAEAGSYTVTLTVTGPNGTDTRIAVGYVNVSLPSLRALPLQPDGAAGLQLSAQAGRSYDIEASANLASWFTLTNLVTTNATTIFHDPAATNFTQRFYRAVIP